MYSCEKSFVRKKFMNLNTVSQVKSLVRKKPTAWNEDEDDICPFPVFHSKYSECLRINYRTLCKKIARNGIMSRWKCVGYYCIGRTHCNAKNTAGDVR